MSLPIQAIRPERPENLSRLSEPSFKHHRLICFKSLYQFVALFCAFTGLSTAEVKADITSNLRAHYPFTAGTGNDVSGNALTATVTDITTTAGPLGISADAALFNGTSSKVVLGTSIAMNNQQTFTAWIKPSAFAMVRPIIAKTDPGYGGEIDCWLHLLPDGKIEWLVNTVSGTYGSLVVVTSSTSVTLNAWTHVAGIIDRSNDQIRLYVNGSLEGAATMGGNIVRNTNRVLRIGSREGNQSNNYFQGAIDEVRIYDRALSLSEIQAVMAVSSGPQNASTNDFDLDRIPDAWENQYGLNASVENFRVGSSVDGNLTVNAGQTTYLNDTAIVISSNQIAGSMELTGVIPITTKIGDLFLLHVTQDGSPAAGAPAGTFELIQIASILDGKVGLKSPLKNTYSPTTGGKIQCLYVPQYDKLQVNGALSARPWNGSNGGIVAVIANEVIVAAGGRINASAAGFRGGVGFSISASYNGLAGIPGEGFTTGVWPPSNGALPLGGGGAGGNNGTGASAIQPGSSGAGGGQSLGEYLSFGGGGGSGGCNSSVGSSIYGFSYSTTQVGGQGGAGGGLCMIISRSIILSGKIESDGSMGQSRYDGNFYGNSTFGSSGGDGAGGSLLLVSRILGSSAISAGSNTMSGKIRVERGTAITTPPATSTGDGCFDNQTFSFLVTYADLDGDYLTDYAEYLAGTSPLLSDTDQDGIPDGWEVRFGTSPRSADANADPDHDGLPNIQEYRAGSNPTSTDGDSDGISDTDELSIFGTNPLLADTDGDGMADSWEVTYGLNPLINDASNDLDLDGLTNREEYDLRAVGYRPNAWNSKSSTSGDYRSLKGEGWIRRGYDKLDRLISTEKENGLAQLYSYDGNSSKKKDIVLTSLDTDGDGLPDAWEFTNGLTYSGSGSAIGDNGPSGDPDHDGFTNLQEWQAGTNPKDAGSHPNSGALPAGSSIAAAPGFIPTNWVMATGQLDGFGADEVVVGADGVIGTATNQFSVYRSNGNSWAITPNNVGNFGINSLAIGEAFAGRGTSIYLGSRPTSGNSGIQEFRRSGTSWLKSSASVADSTATGISQVVGVNSSGILGLLSPASQTADGIYRATLAPDAWSTPAVVSSSAGKRSWPTPMLSGAARWLDAGGIEVNAGSPPLALGAIKNPATGSWYFLTPLMMTWTNAELYATQNGGHLVTVDDAAEQQWIQTIFPSQEMWIGLSLGSSGDGWQWISGTSSSYRNWGPGQPSNSGGTEIFGHIYANGIWNDVSPWGVLKGLVEIPASNVPNQTLSDPSVTAKLIWRGRSLASGQLRSGANSGASLVYTFIDDKDTSGTVNSGDTFVVGEHELTSPSPQQRTTVALPISSSISSSAVGVTILKRQTPSQPNVVAIGEPDGTVSLWTAPDVGSPLARKIFTTEFKGKSWHQFEVFHEANRCEGLVGLLVDPATPSQCQLIHWSPESIEAALNGTAPVLNNVPSARILPTPSQGGTTGSLAVRIWDAEAHGSSLELQYQRGGETNWSNATVNTADGVTFQPTLKLTSQPAGISHTLVWNAAANLGSAFSGTVLLRTRATDSQTGDWSPAMPYAVNTSINLDTDGDGMPDAWEATNGLSSSNPADGTSDYDKDGVSALLEYALAMNAAVPDVALLPILGTTSEAEGKHLTLTYRRPINSGLIYVAERSVTLTPGSWQSGNTMFQELVPLNLGNGIESVTVKDLNSMSASQRAWLRLKVSN